MPLVETTKEASRGGFQGIKKVRGLLVSISDEPQAPPESWTNQKKMIVYADLEDCKVLEMFNGEDEMTLKDGKFRITIPYAEAGKVPNANSIYMRTWVASAEELGHKPSEFIGQYVTLEKQPRKLFEAYEIDKDTKKPKLDENGQKIKKEVLAVDESGQANHFCFVKDSEASDTDIKEYVAGKIAGLNLAAALRQLITDSKIKQFPVYKQLHAEGKLAAELGLVVVDGMYKRPE